MDGRPAGANVRVEITEEWKTGGGKDVRVEITEEWKTGGGKRL